MHDVYSAGGDTTMGADFDLRSWFLQWLNTSGVNVLEPIVERENGQVKKLTIKQTLPLRGKSALHKFKLNVGLYDAQAKAHIVHDVVVTNESEFTEIELPTGVTDLRAVYINED